MRRRLIVGVALALAAVACGRPAAPGSSGAGIEGRTLAGPQCPVERPDSPCPDAPIAAEVRVLRDGKEVTRFTTGADGRFRVPLAPGAYELQPVSTARFPVGKPSQVTVSPGRYTQVDVTFDTGIR